MNHGDIIERGLSRFLVQFEQDDSMDAPWDREDGHGPVSGWTSHDKRPGERLLCGDRQAKRYYDFGAAVKLARKDGWGAPDGAFKPDQTPTKGQIAVAAAEADFKRMQDWCNDHWNYVGVVVTLLDEDDDKTGDTASLWGIESDAGDYFNEVVEELIQEIDVDRLMIVGETL